MGKHRWLILFSIPGIVCFLVFSYFPMIGGLLMAFQDFNPISGFWRSPFVGWENFRVIFRSPDMLNVLRNTVVISLLKFGFGFPLTILFALMLNEVRHLGFKRVIQTAIYMPFFISWVIAAGIWYKFLALDGGAVNEMMSRLGIIGEPVYFFGDTTFFYPILVASELWKSLGYGTIIYIAALAGVNPELYEAAVVDGAGRVRQAWHVSLPGIRPVIVLLLILGTSSLVYAGFDQVYTFDNLSVREVSEILDTYILRLLRTAGMYGYSIGSAMGVFQAAVGLLLFLIANYTAKLLKEESIL